MSVEVQISLSQKAQAFIGRLGMIPQLSVRICQAMDKENQLTVDAIKQKISGSPQKGLRGSQVLHRRTGRLRDSIGRTDTLASGSTGAIEFRSSIGSGVGQGSQAVRYAAIHEFGGTISYPSRPRKGSTVSGTGFGGKTIYRGAHGKFQSGTKAYNVKMPERSYIRSTIRDRQQFYSNRISNSIIGFWKGNN
jgi:phage gpG-like protein